jgi:acid phosphatase family membrane protein YuiD
MNEYAYFLTPFFAWLVAGCLKFLINCIRAKRLAFDLIGYGGFPSNHSAIVSSMAALIAFRDGINTPAFGVAIALAFIVILDASSLRRQVGKHAAEINQLNHVGGRTSATLLRERMGHTRLEIFSGILVGVAVGFVVAQSFSGS